MEGKTMLLLALAGVGGYLLYKKYGGAKKTAPSDFRDTAAWKAMNQEQQSAWITGHPMATDTGHQFGPAMQGLPEYPYGIDGFGAVHSPRAHPVQTMPTHGRYAHPVVGPKSHTPLHGCSGCMGNTPEFVAAEFSDAFSGGVE